MSLKYLFYLLNVCMQVLHCISSTHFIYCYFNPKMPFWTTRHSLKCQKQFLLFCQVLPKTLYQCRGAPEGSVWAVGWSAPEHQLVAHPLPPASLFHLQAAANSFILINQMEQNQCLFQKLLFFIQNESSSLVLLGLYCNTELFSCAQHQTNEYREYFYIWIKCDY